MATQNTPNFGAGSAYPYGANLYPNPFCDIASMYFPDNIQEAFGFTEHLMLTMAPFMAVVNRVVSYFLTDIDIDAPSDDVSDKYRDMLEDKLHILDKLQTIGRDYFAYGNSFVSMYFPFTRFLVCPRCGLWYHSETLRYEFGSEDASFTCRCPKCGFKGKFTPRDMPDVGNSDGVKMIRWNPKRMHIKVHPISGNTVYEYDLEPDFVKKVREGSRFYVDSSPMGVLETCVAGKANNDARCKFRLNENAIHHMREAALAGLDIKGWGIPPLLPYFKLAYYIQLLRRYDEAIALDFIAPFRILYPQFQGPQGQDALTTISMRSFIAAMNGMVERKRRNITTYEVAPFPVGYQMVGGEAKQLAPKDSIQEAITELLNAMGFPQDLFSGSLTLQAAPVALRLFERQFNVLVDNFNIILQWISDRISVNFKWATPGSVKVRLSPITLADDLERKSMQMQAAAGMDVSKQTAYKAYGLDYLDEQRRILSEQTEIQRMQVEQQMENQQEQENGSGDQPPPGGDMSATPGDVREQAAALAHQLLTQVPPTQVRGQLIKIKNSNPTLHALVKQFMAEERQSAASQGQSMILEQQRNQGM